MTLGSKNKSLLKHLSLSSSSSFAIRWIQLVVTTLVVTVALTNLTYGFKSNTEGRKLFGGYRITPKQCRATKMLPSSDPRAKGPTICMFNHECAQRNGEVVGACMDGFLFGACCQVPNDQKPENTLINDAQNAYYHMYQNQKLQQQEAETNKIISQAYESFAENSALQQSFESNQTQDSPYGGSINSNYNVNSIDSHQQDTTKQVNTSTQGTTGNTPSSVSVADKTPNTQTSNDIQTKPLQGASNIKIHDNSIKMSSPSQSSQNDDFVLHILNTLPPGDSNHHVTYATEIPNKISDSLTGQISSESNSFEEELPMATNKPSVVNSQPPNHEDSIKPQHTETYENQNKQTIQQHHVSESEHQDEQQLFGSVTFTHSDITHPGADADLIDDLQFSTGYGPQPLFVSAPPKPIQSYNPDSNKQTSNKYEDTTSSSPITTHVDSIETIIQQLNNNNSNPGPAYNIINHHEQQQEQYQTSTYNTNSVVVTKKPSITSHDEQDNTKHTTSASLSNNGMKLNDKQSISNNYGQISFTSSTSSNLSSAPAFESTTVNTLKDPNKYVLQDHTMPETNYNDYHTSKHPTSNFNKMPANSISYPIDMSYIQGGANLETEGQTHHQEENIHLSHLNSQTTATTQSDEQSNHQYNQSSYSDIEASHTNTEQHQKYQQQQQEHINQVSYASQNNKEKITEAQTIQNYITETHQRPITSYIGVVTSQNYNNQPVPNEVVVSSYTTKVDENSEISTEYKPIITTNEITTTSHKTTAKPEKTTSYIKRPTLVTKRPNNQKPTRTNNHRPTTFGYSSTNNTTTQQHYSTTPIETKTPSPAELLSEKPTISYKPASTSYLTEPTTPRPTVTLQFHHGQEVSVIQADDKLDAFVHSTAENLASDTPSQDTLSFDPPVFISGGVQVHNQKPQYNMHKKPTFVRIQTTQTPPAPTLIITPKPTTLQTTASTFTTSLSDYGSTVFVYNSFVTRRPALAENTAADYMGISTVDSNDFDDPGYYGTADHNKLGKPTYVSDSIGNIYPVPTDDKPAFPGYYGPTPIYPVFQIPGEKLDSPNDEQIYTSPNDFINFPPVRNPNLNMSATSSAVTSDLELSTPAFVEDSVLKNKMNTLVHKIVESLQGNFEALSNMIDESNYTAAAQTYQASPSTSTATKKPTRKPATKVSTAKPNATTRKPITKVSTKPPNKKPPTTKKPEATTKRTATRRTTTTTKRPATRKPTRKTTTTTKAPAEDDLVDEEDEEDVNPTNNEIIEEETQNTGESGRKIQCGMRPHVKSGRIVGGKGATFGAYPWQVLVRESTWLGLFTKNKCGGVLITNRYVITAAHCQPGFLASLVAVMGEFDISGDLESKRAVTKNVKRVIVHRQYDPATFENDIALLELESPVQFDTHIVPICMPSDVADFTGRMATVTGWGRLKYGGGVPSVLQEVQVPVIENSVCQEMFHTAGHNKKILKSFLCAGYANGQKDSCEGDSGGPLVLQRADGRYELAGTVSHGIKCASPYLPGVYMRTTYYKPWLRSITGVK